ncbi:WAS/WASL-interacting protein family member 3-like [Cervus elaphus]|uniref:WAS/WASL-interacting protein family member 3-like n=1 Tax=Cervus elaphus TaxID=9860 RepID=UPI001CC29630|nr:WAS/WASL-interacting protein family member 3-like [Cervus elaphus]
MRAVAERLQRQEEQEAGHAHSMPDLQLFSPHAQLLTTWAGGGESRTGPPGAAGPAPAPTHPVAPQSLQQDAHPEAAWNCPPQVPGLWLVAPEELLELGEGESERASREAEEARSGRRRRRRRRRRPEAEERSRRRRGARSRPDRAGGGLARRGAAAAAQGGALCGWPGPARGGGPRARSRYPPPGPARPGHSPASPIAAHLGSLDPSCGPTPRDPSPRSFRRPPPPAGVWASASAAPFDPLWLRLLLPDSSNPLPPFHELPASPPGPRFLPHRPARPLGSRPRVLLPGASAPSPRTRALPHQLLGPSRGSLCPPLPASLRLHSFSRAGSRPRRQPPPAVPPQLPRAPPLSPFSPPPPPPPADSSARLGTSCVPAILSRGAFDSCRPGGVCPLPPSGLEGEGPELVLGVGGSRTRRGTGRALLSGPLATPLVPVEAGGGGQPGSAEGEWLPARGLEVGVESPASLPAPQSPSKWSPQDKAMLVLLPSQRQVSDTPAGHLPPPYTHPGHGKAVTQTAPPGLVSPPTHPPSQDASGKVA